MNPTFEQRILGALYGSLVGDALGVPVEFQNRAARVTDPVIGMRGYGTHRQPPGTWSDDGALLLCSAESIVEKGFDTADMGARFVQWYRKAHWSAHGEVFDSGHATSHALDRIIRGTRAEEAGGRDEFENGNGSLMRIMPVALASWRQTEAVFCDRLERASSITHAHAISKMACVFHGHFVRAILDGYGPVEALKGAQGCFCGRYERASDFGVFHTVLGNVGKFTETPSIEIDSGGYVMDTLLASLWCVLTTDSFQECVLRAVNLGGDTDTTGCVAGGLAGLMYGVDAIPAEWLEALPRQGELTGLLDCFLHLCKSQTIPKRSQPVRGD